MNRALSLGIFMAILVGCAASAMRLGTPLPATASKATASNTVHVATVTGPCYKPAGGDCASTYHEVWGQVTFETGACDNLTWCPAVTTTTTGYPNKVTFSGSAVFNKVPVCVADEGGPGPYLVNALPENTMDSVAIFLFNASGTHQSAQTLTHTFQCMGD
jgi:hypothetical protein